MLAHKNCSEDQLSWDDSGLQPFPSFFQRTQGIFTPSFNAMTTWKFKVKSKTTFPELAAPRLTCCVPRQLQPFWFKHKALAWQLDVAPAAQSAHFQSNRQTSNVTVISGYLGIWLQ